MCGIIGCIGEENVKSITLDGLKKLEYRGYDSAGIAVIDKIGRVKISKCKGRISELEKKLKTKNITGQISLGHTRWATHGEPSQKNAHPHIDCSKKFVVVHNGIIENYSELKKNLQKNGCKFESETDTEIIVHLISKLYKGDLKKAVIEVSKKLEGSYALGVISSKEPDKIIAVRYNSPLIIGLGDGENFIASDVPALISRTKKVIYLHNKQVVVLKKNNVEVFDFNNKKVSVKIDRVSYHVKSAKKGKYKHFMLKEIYEQPKVLSALISQHITSSNDIQFDNLNFNRKTLEKIDNIIIVACGTAYHAGLVGKYIFESVANIAVEVALSSEFRYRNPILKKNTLVIAISQSGETADTLAAVKEVRKRSKKVLSICNVLGSSLTRESDANIYTNAGPEIGVASTKVYIAQLIILYFFALYLSGVKNILKISDIKKAVKSLKTIPDKQKDILKQNNSIKKIAKKHLNFGAFLYLGRNINYPSALEGALKLKEISYIPAEGYAAGEMKHGPIALIDEYRAVVCIANDSPVYDKMISNVREILARCGKLIGVVTKGNTSIEEHIKELIYIPKIENIFSPLLTAVPLQLLAYHISSLKGYDVDKPRNLAKSVTVE